VIGILACVRVNHYDLNIASPQERRKLTGERRVSEYDRPLDQLPYPGVIDQCGVGGDCLASEASTTHHLGKQWKPRCSRELLGLRACSLACDHDGKLIT